MTATAAVTPVQGVKAFLYHPFYSDVFLELYVPELKAIFTMVVLKNSHEFKPIVFSAAESRNWGYYGKTDPKERTKEIIEKFISGKSVNRVSESLLTEIRISQVFCDRMKEVMQRPTKENKDSYSHYFPSTPHPAETLLPEGYRYLSEVQIDRYVRQQARKAVKEDLSYKAAVERETAARDKCEELRVNVAQLILATSNEEVVATTPVPTGPLSEGRLEEILGRDFLKEELEAKIQSVARGVAAWEAESRKLEALARTIEATKVPVPPATTAAAASSSTLVLSVRAVPVSNTTGN